MNPKTLSILIFMCLFTIQNSSAQEYVGPNNPLYKWLGEWTIEPDVATKAKLEKEGAYYAEQLRLKIELTEGKSGVLETSYTYLNGRYFVSVQPLFYVSALEETKGVNQFGSFSTVYPEPGKEVNTFTTFMNGNQSTTEITWFSEDEAIIDLKNNKDEDVNPERRNTLKRVTSSQKIPLPESVEGTAQHLLATLKKAAEGPFDFTDQFMSLDGFHAMALVDTLPMASFRDEQFIQMTEIDRLNMIRYKGFSNAELNGKPLDWNAITYQDHTAFYYVDRDASNGEEYGDDIPCWKVKLKFRYMKEDYNVTGYYLELKEKFHLLHIEPDF